MKILILSAGDKYTLGWSYKRAFESLGHEVTVVDPMEALRTSHLWSNRVIRRLFERPLITKFNRLWLPSLLEDDFDFVWVGKGAWAVPWLWQEFKRQRPKTQFVCYNGDNPLVTYSRGGNLPWITESIGCFDLFCTYNSSLVEPLYTVGARHVACIPFAWDPEIHPVQPIEVPKFDVLFIGNADSYRQNWLTEFLEKSKDKKWNVAIYGAWKAVRNPNLRATIRPQQVVGPSMAKLISQAKVVLNILRIQNEGTHNMRTFETPGCGGLMASQHSEQQATFFPDREAAIYFHDTTDAVLLIEEALKNTEWCVDLRNRARSIVQHHTYEERARSLIGHLFR